VAAVLDVHDDPLSQREALGLAGSPDANSVLRDLRDSNLAAFRWLVSQSASFTSLAALDPARTIIAPNATDTAHVVPGPWPSEPTIGFVSGAAPSRGIESLVEAARLVRRDFADVHLRLWLIGTDPDSERYLDELRASYVHEPWIQIGTAPYERLSQTLAQATVLTIPHPPSPYLDAVLPIKLFDSMAAGRPLVVTPRFETAQLVDRAGFGIVTEGDSPEAIAAALCRILGDERLAQSMGARARLTAEREFDWRVVGARLADELLSVRRYHPVLGLRRVR